MKPYNRNNITAFFARFVSPLILKNKIVATVMGTIFDFLEEFNTKVDKVTNEDI